MMTDPIADMLTRIRNAQMSKKGSVDIPFSKMKMALLEILSREGYLGGIKEVESGNRKILRAELKYEGREPQIRSVCRESKPGHRVYHKANDIPTVLNGFGIAVLSTPRGLMTGKEAKELGIGGELICTVY